MLSCKFHADDYSVSVPNPWGEVLGTFFFFELLIRIFIMFFLLCLLDFADIIPNLWFWTFRQNASKVYFFESVKTVETRVEKLETHKTPLEQSSLILSIYFSLWPLEYTFQQTPHIAILLYTYTDIYEIIGDKGNFICR